MVNYNWNVWAKENRRLKQEYANRTPPTGGSGVTQNTPTPVGNITFEHIIDFGQYYRACDPLREVVLYYTQPVQILPEPIKIDLDWSERCDELEGIYQNLLEWCQELTQDIVRLKRDKQDKYSLGVTLL